ncbi:hypothetical protein DL764_010159 [Monosporascus ibericus]|uniref:Uncharacterized protein n=1 Tax=Monosporascus ibericus TaxID=155417 RepID=A0A4Q4STA6_9PEZI|nr:hypothetical protein DL764_010159 [Monosporascus ibericus]
MHFTLLLPFLAPALLASPLPSSQESNGNEGRDTAGPASMPHISSVSYSGPGCPSSAPGVVRSGGFAEPAFRLSEFEARVPDGAQTEHCQVHVQAAGASPGWQLGLESITVRGYAVLDPGASVDYYVTSFFSQDADRTVSLLPPVSLLFYSLADMRGFPDTNALSRAPSPHPSCTQPK